MINNVFINCKATQSVTGIVNPGDLFNNGGHVEQPHSVSHPLFDDVGGGLTCVDCTDLEAADDLLVTFTNDTTVSVLYPLP